MTNIVYIHTHYKPVKPHVCVQTLPHGLTVEYLVLKVCPSLSSRELICEQV